MGADRTAGEGSRVRRAGTGSLALMLGGSLALLVTAAALAVTGVLTQLSGGAGCVS
jgi:hypothetical protein